MWEETKNLHLHRCVEIDDKGLCFSRSVYDLAVFIVVSQTKSFFLAKQKWLEAKIGGKNRRKTSKQFSKVVDQHN